MRVSNARAKLKSLDILSPFSGLAKNASAGEWTQMHISTETHIDRDTVNSSDDSDARLFGEHCSSKDFIVFQCFRNENGEREQHTAESNTRRGTVIGSAEDPSVPISHSSEGPFMVFYASGFRGKLVGVVIAFVCGHLCTPTRESHCHDLGVLATSCTGPSQCDSRVGVHADILSLNHCSPRHPARARAPCPRGAHTMHPDEIPC
eukprot:COSAG02_NODE_34_length_49821_cov_105.420438_1_plen_205_part_00